MRLNRILYFVIILLGFSGFCCDQKKPVQPEKGIQKEALFPDTPYVPKPVVLDYDKSYFDRTSSFDRDQFIDEFVKEGKWEKNRFLWAKSCGSECIPLIEKRLENDIDPILIKQEDNSAGQFYNLMFLLGAIGDDKAIPVFEKALKKSILIDEDLINFNACHSILNNIALLASQGSEKGIELIYKLCFQENWLKRFQKPEKNTKYNYYLSQRLPAEAINFLGKSGTKQGHEYLIKIIERPEDCISKLTSKAKLASELRVMIDYAGIGLINNAINNKIPPEVYASGRKEIWDTDEVLDAYMDEDFPTEGRMYYIFNMRTSITNSPEIVDLIFRRLADESRVDEWPLLIELLGWQPYRVELTKLVAFIDERLTGKMNLKKIEALGKVPLTLGLLATSHFNFDRKPTPEANRYLNDICGNDIWNKAAFEKQYDESMKKEISNSWKVECAKALAVVDQPEARKRLKQMRRKTKPGTFLRLGLDRAMKTSELVQKKFGPVESLTDYYDYEKTRKEYLKQYVYDKKER